MSLDEKFLRRNLTSFVDDYCISTLNYNSFIFRIYNFFFWRYDENKLMKRIDRFFASCTRENFFGPFKYYRIISKEFETKTLKEKIVPKENDNKADTLSADKVNSDRNTSSSNSVTSSRVNSDPIGIVNYVNYDITLNKLETFMKYVVYIINYIYEKNKCNNFLVINSTDENNQLFFIGEYSATSFLKFNYVELKDLIKEFIVKEKINRYRNFHFYFTLSLLMIISTAILYLMLFVINNLSN